MKTVGEALVDWRARHGRPAASTPSRVFWVAVGPLRIPVPHPGQLHWHDLHHVALDYAPDFVGEVEISAFELRTGVRTWIVRLLCIAGVLAGLVVAPRRTVLAWRRGLDRRNLYDCATPNEEVLRWPLSTLLTYMRLTD